MQWHPFSPFIRPPELAPDAVECLDTQGRPLLVTSKKTAPQTGLAWRLVGASLLVSGNLHSGPRIVLRRATAEDSLFAGLWELPVLGPLHAGEAPLDAARRLFAIFGVETPRLRLFATYPPGTLASVFPPSRFGRVGLTLFRGGPVQPYLSTGQDMLLDADELPGLIRTLPESVSPVARLMFEQGGLTPLEGAYTASCNL